MSLRGWNLPDVADPCRCTARSASPKISRKTSIADPICSACEAMGCMLSSLCGNPRHVRTLLANSSRSPAAMTAVYGDTSPPW
jgi:hypothetical protein